MTPALVASTAFTISMIVSPTVAINIDGKNITLPIPEHSTYTVNKGSSSFHMDFRISVIGLAIRKIIIINVPVLLYPFALALAA